MENSLPEGGWWVLPDDIQSKILDDLPAKDEINLPCIRRENEWVFSLPEYQTYNEQLINGTEDSIDWHYNRLTNRNAQPGDTIIITCSLNKIPSCHTVLIHIEEDENNPDCNWYYDTEAHMKTWLCPFVQVLFRKVPERMWIEFSGMNQERQ